MASAEVLIVHATAQTYLTLLEPRFPDVRFRSIRLDPAALDRLPANAPELLGQADAIFSIGRWVNEQSLAACRKLRWFQCLITGTDHLDPFIDRERIILTNARGIHGPQMAEMAALHMLALSRQLKTLVRNQTNHVWDRIKPRVLDGRTVVILGVGAIAESVARLCAAFGMRVLGVSRTPRRVDGFDRIYGREELLTAVAAGDFVIVLLPRSPENAHVVDCAVLRAMKPSAFLINLSRGGVVDEPALLRAIEDGEIAGAGLDVFEASPLPADSPLWDNEKIFITPFVGGQSDRYEEDIMTIIEPNLRAFLSGRPEGMVNRVPAAKS